jgi:hypothetical protein
LDNGPTIPNKETESKLIKMVIVMKGSSVKDTKMDLESRNSLMAINTLDSGRTT